MTARELVEKLRELESRATKGPWRWFNGCSWWRLGNDDRDTAVMYPTKDSDGHPNTVIRDDDKELIAALRNAAPSLLPLVAALVEEVEAWREWESIRSDWGSVVKGMASQATLNSMAKALCDRAWSLTTVRAATDAAAAKCGEGI